MLKEIKMLENPYNRNTCDYWVFHTIACLFTARDYIKISSVQSRCKWKLYSKKTIGASLINLMNDGYLKFDSKTCTGEHLYIQKNQVKGE